MAYKITEDCVNCGICESECPADAIIEGTERFIIDESTCVDCGVCADVCSTDAVVKT